MYNCSVCKMEVIVVGVPAPIRACDCTQEVIVNGEKVKKPATIIADMEAETKGHAKLNT